MTDAATFEDTSPATVLKVLRSTTTVAIVGASANPSRASYFVATYLRADAREFTVWYVNPRKRHSGSNRLPVARRATGRS